MNDYNPIIVVIIFPITLHFGQISRYSFIVKVNYLDARKSKNLKWLILNDIIQKKMASPSYH